MPEAIIRSIGGLLKWAGQLAQVKFPITLAWSAGEPTRRARQNKLAQRWFTDIARHFGDRDREDVRAECKLRFGVPILRAENDTFRASYDDVMKGHSYETKLAAIKAFDMPVTRLMTVKQMTAFMDAVQREFAPRGVRLTDPEALKYEDVA